MGDIKVFNSAGNNDNSETITNRRSSSSRVGRVEDLYLLKSEHLSSHIDVDLSHIEDQIALINQKADTNTANLNKVVKEAPESMDTLKEVFDNLDIDDFIAGLESD